MGACCHLSVCLTPRLRCHHRPRGECATHRLGRGAGRGLAPHAERRVPHAAVATVRPAWRLAQPDLPPEARRGCASARRVVGLGRGDEKARGPHGRTLPCRAGGVDAFIVCINLVPAIASRPSPSVISHQHLHLHMMCLNVHRCALCARPRAGAARGAGVSLPHRATSHVYRIVRMLYAHTMHDETSFTCFSPSNFLLNISMNAPEGCPNKAPHGTTPCLPWQCHGISSCRKFNACACHLVVQQPRALSPW